VPSVRSNPGMFPGSDTKMQLRVTNESRPPTAMSLEPCRTSVEWLKYDDRMSLTGAMSSQLFRGWGLKGRTAGHESIGLN
jgi:hypothetical protein